MAYSPPLQTYEHLSTARASSLQTIDNLKPRPAWTPLHRRKAKRGDFLCELRVNLMAEWLGGQSWVLAKPVPVR